MTYWLLACALVTLVVLLIYKEKRRRYLFNKELDEDWAYFLKHDRGNH